MEDKYSVEFDEDLINKIFCCKLCEKLLRLPIMLVRDVGDICNPCFQAMTGLEKEEHIITENTSLGKLLKKIPFPCQFRCHGCVKRVSYINLMDHEKSCMYRITPCIFPKCNLTSTRLGIKMHIVEMHKEKILSKEDDSSIIETSLLENSDVCRIFDTTLTIFIIRIKVDASENKLSYAIYDFGNETSNYSFKIDNIYDDKLYSNISAKIVHSIDKFSSHDDFATVLDFRSIKNDNDKTIKTVVKIWKQGENVFDADKLRLFECPNCHELMRAPIYQCTTGHSVCSNCKPNLTSCPVCRVGFGNGRNYILEKFSQSIAYPCKYKGNGCRVKAVSVINHESNCYYKDYACLFLNCQFRGRHGLFLDHLKEEHGQLCFYKNILNFPLGSNTTTTQIYCILFENQIFKVTFGHDAQNVKFAVEYVIPSETPNEYVYEFCIINKNNDNERIILIKQNCIYWTADKETEKHCLYKNDLVKSFVGENDVYHYLIAIYRSNEGIGYNLGGKNKGFAPLKNMLPSGSC